jgi:amidase
MYGATMSHLPSLDATAQAELVRSGEVSPAELVDAAIDRIAELDPQLNVLVTDLFEKGRAAAAGDLPDGPFRGVPCLVKDLACHTAGDPMYEGMRFLRDAGWTEPEDSELARRLRAAGLVILGRTNCPELGILPTTEPEAFGPTRNPWALDRSTGGSSGGSAAAVAAGLVPFAHANDGGGSIRIPAANCGLVGLKPSRARISLGPHYGDVFAGLVNEGFVTRSVRDTAALLDAVHGPAPGEPYAAPAPERPFRDEVGAQVGALRIGIRVDPPGRMYETHADCIAAAQDAAGLLESLGHTVEPADLAAFDDPSIVETFLVRWLAGTAWSLDFWGRKVGREVTADDVEPLTWALAEAGRGHTAADLYGAVERHQLLGREVGQWYARGFDVLLTPTTAEPATPLGAYDGPEDQPLFGIVRATPVAAFTAAANLTGQPSISLPLHWTDDGIPVGVMLTAAYGREDVLLRLAAQLEEARPWADRRPPVFAGSPASTG